MAFHSVKRHGVALHLVGDSVGAREAACRPAAFGTVVSDLAISLLKARVMQGILGLLASSCKEARSLNV